ncbi:MAG: DUF305 domain-containing protein [Geodermatophilaceae bacterium]
MHTRVFVMLTATVAAAVLAGCGGSDTNSTAADVTDTDHNAADVTFATDMIPHHRQAVMMAELAESRSDNPDVLGLASAIRDAQDPEIQTMSGWLEEWGEPVPGEMDGMEGMDMPGMMSEQEMATLEAAEGDAFDEMFLESMIAHHTGAIQMAQAQQADGQYADAVDLAEQIEQSQTAEIATMEDLLQG